MNVAAVPETVDLSVQSIAAGGDGVGRSEGLVVFVPRTAPGDVARVRIHAVKRFARGRLESLIVPSEQRVEPPCKHYRDDDCGGCQLQHLLYDAQLEAKRGIVRDAIARIAKRNADVGRTRASERQWRYRSKLTLAMRRMGSEWMMGLHPYADPVAIFQLEDCPITDERVVATWREIMNAARFLPEEAELRGTVRLADDDIVVHLKGAAVWPTSVAFFDAVPSASALWWSAGNDAPRVLHERRHAPAGVSFGQINARVAEQLRAHVLERARAHAPETVVDAYAGAGETAIPLASSGIRVTTIELDREAASLCARQLPERSRSLVGRVESLIAKALPADVVIVNPPRAGVHERVTSVLEDFSRRPRAIIYVSCDPATLARDLGRLPSYRIATIETFDMFPQTAHVETVCELVPAS
ncbi:MAG TPA: TRAM domain-containing protein [Gemmatimonadaceae bacterium]|nr:TRAM domain-containing protein [Gemmatimonadaceae bacterium]